MKVGPFAAWPRDEVRERGPASGPAVYDFFMIQAAQTVIARARGPLLSVSLALMSAWPAFAHADPSAAPNVCIDGQGREIYSPTGETIDQTVIVVGRRLPKPVPPALPATTHSAASSSRALALIWPVLLLAGLLFAGVRLSQRRAARPM
jgi:hypothetical protein